MKEHLFNFHDVFLLITTAICLLLCLFQWLIFEKRPERGVLAGFLFSLAVTNITVLFMWSDKIIVPPFAVVWILPYTLMASLLLHGPLLFLYVRMLTRHNAELHKFDLWHLAPLVVLFVVMASLGIHSVDLLQRTERPAETDIIGIIWAIAKIQPVVYCVAAVLLVQRYIKRLQHQYASFSLTEPVWLMMLSGGFLLNWGWSFLVYLIAKFSSPQLADKLGIADNYVTFVLIIALFVYGVAHAQKLLSTKPDTPRESHEDNYDKRDIDRIVQAMETDLLYLEHNVNLESVAEKVKLSSRTVSQIINKHFGTNFYEYINSYRIEAAKRMLADPAYKEMTILDILMKSGFNSKSAFHRFFNRLVGTSPTAYRKKMLTEKE